MNSLILCVCFAEIASITASMYFPALLPGFQAEWGLTNTAAGWISGIYFGGYAAHCWKLFGFRSWMVAFMFFSLRLTPQMNIPMSLQNLATPILLAGVPASILGNEGALYWGRRRFITVIMLGSGIVGSIIGFCYQKTMH